MSRSCLREFTKGILGQIARIDSLFEPIRVLTCQDFRVALLPLGPLEESPFPTHYPIMATPNDPHPIDPDDLDYESEETREAGIPEAPAKRRDPMENLSHGKESIPAFQTQDRRQASRLKGMDLEEGNVEDLSESIDPQTLKRSKEAARQADKKKLQPEARTPEQEERGSAREQEENLRREGGRPKSVRPVEFEPTAWESSSTKLDIPRGDDGEPLPRVGFAHCLQRVSGGLKAFWGRLNVIEMASVVAFLIVALAGLFIFRNLVHSGPRPENDATPTLQSVDLPAQGDSLSINDIQAQWRAGRPGEIVRVGVLRVPEVTVDLGGGSGFLRILYRDETGKIRGDIFVAEVRNGQVNGKSTVTTVCSEGYENTMKLVECQAGRLDPWTVEVFESKAYDLPIDQWRSLAFFGMPNKAEAPSESGS